MIIDLRSDTVTRPTASMLDAMLQAEVGDDVFDEDPTVKELEQRLATMFNKPRALFFPSGSMANQAALKLHTQPGDQVICDITAHIYNYEAGGAAFNSGISCKLIQGQRGMFTTEQVLEAINPSAFYYAKTRLVEVENTSNKGGGACWDFQELKRIAQVCKEHKLGYHLDGARLWNALVAKEETPKQYGDLFDTISVCLSKGLGCPVGSVLIGDEAIMEDAVRIRKMFGGNMRQIGYLAAAGLYALDHHVERLAEDHMRAKDLGEALQKLDIVKTVNPVETNIVIFELYEDVSEEAFLKQLEAHQIKIIGMGDHKLRMVTHLDYTETMHQTVLSVLKHSSI